MKTQRIIALNLAQAVYVYSTQFFLNTWAIKLIIHMDLLDSQFSAIYFAVELFGTFLVHKGNGFYSLTLNLWQSCIKTLLISFHEYAFYQLKYLRN